MLSGTLNQSNLGLGGKEIGVEMAPYLSTVFAGQAVGIEKGHNDI